MSARRLLLLIPLLLVFAGLYWLVFGPDYTGPDGTRVYGPQEEWDGLTTKLTFTVRWPEGQLRGDTDFLHGVARQKVAGASSGEYTVRFLDKDTGQSIASYRFSSVGDLLFATKVTELP